MPTGLTKNQMEIMEQIVKFERKTAAHKTQIESLIWPCLSPYTSAGYSFLLKVDRRL